MYKENEKNNKKNKDIYFNETTENINEANEIYGKNIINIILDIELKENEIIIFNQNKNNEKEIKDNLKVFLENKRINLINEGNKWKIDYKFEKEGKYNLKIMFENNIKDMNSFFEKCSNIYSIDVSNLDSSKVNDMGFMFAGCCKLKEIEGINRLNTNQVTNMGEMFNECNELEYLDLSSLNTSNVIDMGYMFYNCNKLKANKRNNGSINEFECFDLSNFNTSNVTDMDFMFGRCNKLKQIKGINKFNTIKVINMKGMFGGCQELEYLDLSNFNTSNVTDMALMFNKCHKLKEIKGINNFNTSRVTDMSNMFDECNELEYLISSKFNTSNDNKNNFGGLNSKLTQEKTKLENELDLEREKNKDILYNKEKPIVVTFSTTDQKIFSIDCYNSEIFSSVEEKLFLKYPKLRHENIYFIASGNIINPSVTIEQNKIKNGTTILIDYYE